MGALIVGGMLISAAAQRPAIGAGAPLPSVRDLQGAERSLKELAGPHGLVILFWAGWSDRSIQELKRLDAERREIEEHGVTVAAVNVDHQVMQSADLQAVRDLVAKLAVAVPVFVDEGLELFNAYGVISVPSTAVIDGGSKLHFFAAGYSNSGREELFDAIHRLAGLETKKPLPAGPSASPVAQRRLALGRSELGTRRTAAAKASFEAAAQADPAFADPIVELAALALDDNDLQGADALLTRALALQADHAAALREGARRRALAGELEASRSDLSALAEQPDPVIHAYLAFLLMASGDLQAAEAACDRAVEAGGPDPRGTAPAAAMSLEAARQAMVDYRRSALRRGR